MGKVKQRLEFVRELSHVVLRCGDCHATHQHTALGHELLLHP